MKQFEWETGEIWGNTKKKSGGIATEPKAA